jgi:hypothetical protein
LRVPLIGSLLKQRHARTLLQIPLFIVSAAMIVHGLFGPQLAPKNLATTFTWVHFRGAKVRSPGAKLAEATAQQMAFDRVVRRDAICLRVA